MGEGRDARLGGDGVRISRKGIVRARRAVCGMECRRNGRRLRHMHKAWRGDAQNGAKGARVCGGMAGARAGRRRAAGVGGGVCRGACVGCVAPWERHRGMRKDLVKLQLNVKELQAPLPPWTKPDCGGGDNARSARAFSAV